MDLMLMLTIPSIKLNPLMNQMPFLPTLFGMGLVIHFIFSI